MFRVFRDLHNPLLSPDPNVPWYAEAAFNPSPVVHDNATHLVFRAAAHPAYYRGYADVELSVIGITSSPDGQTFGSPRQLVSPQEPWEEYGCEDPRVTKLDDTYYIFYTALGGFPFGPDNIKVAVATTKDLHSIDERHLVTPFNAKAMALFPQRVNGKLLAILTVNSDLPPSKISIAKFDTVEQMWSPEFWNEWYANLDSHTLTLSRSGSDHVEVGAPPIWTKDGWLLIYSHIQNYFTENKTFGIEAALLDLEDPTKVISRTVFPFMVPEEGYERYGRLPNIIFPSGAVVEGDDLIIYYGNTDTGSCRATLSFSALMESLSPSGEVRQHTERFSGNPILGPIPENFWESSHVLNPAAIDIDGTVYILYRAVGPDNTSVVGLAKSRDGYRIDERLADPIYVPRAEFELKHGGPTDNSGCEDARVVRIGDDLHITYTAYDSVSAPQVATSHISVEDFLAGKWEAWSWPELVSPDGIDDKDAAIFPRQFDGQYMVLHRISGHVCADFVADLDFHNHKLTRCIQMFGPRPGMWDSRKVGIAGPPIETPAGWVLFYHGITDTGAYCLGAVLLELDDPTTVIGRTAQPIMTPVEDWEIEGWIGNVVFPCGQVVRDGKVLLYYGGADHVIGVATLDLNQLVTWLSN